MGGTDVAPRTVLHMTHGFGASSSSWMPVIDQLSRGLGALAVAHDTPGFGLTDRPSWWMAPKYSLQFNAGEGGGAVDDGRVDSGLSRANAETYRS